MMTSSCIAGSSISLDGGNDPDNSSTNSGSVMHTVQKTTVRALLGGGLQLGLAA
jgi:hypothetical protein